MSLPGKRGTLSRTYAERIKNDFVDAISGKLANLKTEEAHRRARGHLEKAQGQFDLRVQSRVLDTERARARAFISRQLERAFQTGRQLTPEQRANIMTRAERRVSASSRKMIEQIKVEVLRDLNSAIGRISEQQDRARPGRSARREFQIRAPARRNNDRGLGD